MTGKPTYEELEQKVKDLERTDSRQKESAFGEATRTHMAAALRKLEKEIAERRGMEKALRESQDKYRTLVEESFDGIFIQKGPKIVFANKRLHQMLGYSEGELVGQDHWVVYHE